MNDETVVSAEELIIDSAPKKRLSIDWSWQLVKDACTLQPSRRASVQLVRSLVVSVIALVADFGSLVLFKEKFGVHYLQAAALSFCLGVVVNYALSVWWVFADRQMESQHIEFVVFFVICAIGLGLNLAIIAGLVQFLTVDYRLAKVVSSVVVFFWNFIARKKLLY
jgi:putative flippase GtrA